MPPDVVDQVLRRLSTKPGVLRAQAERDTLGADFLMFQRSPLVEFAAGNYICPDPGFLLEKTGASLYWTLHEATGRSHDLLTHGAESSNGTLVGSFRMAIKGLDTCCPHRRSLGAVRPATSV